MAGWVLTLSNGVETADFLSGEEFMLGDGGFQLSNPQKVQVWTDVSPYGGAKLVSDRRGNRKATIIFEVRGLNRMEVRASLMKLERIVKDASLWQLGQGTRRVQLAYHWHIGYEDAVIGGGRTIEGNDPRTGPTYFEVLDGELSEPDNIMSVEQMHAKIDSRYVVSEVRLELVLSPDTYDVPPADGQMIEIPLKNPNSSGGGANYDLGGVWIGDYQDTRVGYAHKHVNWVDIRGEDIEGDTPALARILICDNTANDGCGRFAMGITQQTSFKHQWNYNDPDLAWNGNYSPVDFPNTYSPEGKGKRLSVPKSTTEVLLFSVNITDPDAYGSDYYRLIIHGPHQQFNNKFLYRAKITTNYLSVSDSFYTTEWVASNNDYWLDFGTVPLPPFSKRIPNSSPITIKFYANSDVDGAAEYIYVDYALLIPCSQAYRVVLSRITGTAMSQWPTVVDDAWKGVAYCSSMENPDDPAATSMALVATQFSPIKLVPGVDQRIIFFPSEAHTPFFQGDTDFYKIKLYYSPTYFGVQ